MQCLITEDKKATIDSELFAMALRVILRQLAGQLSEEFVIKVSLCSQGENQVVKIVVEGDLNKLRVLAAADNTGLSWTLVERILTLIGGNLVHSAPSRVILEVPH